MHITVEPSEHHAVLHLRGEFDTYYCPLLQEEVDGIQKTGVHHVVLNLRMVKFINSTALGAIIKASKALGKEGGKLVISRPSAFCRDIIEKVGLDRVVPIYDTDEDGIAALRGAQPGQSSEAAGFEQDPSSVLFTLTDKERLEHFIAKVKAENPVHGHAFGSNWSGVGRMAALSDKGVAFTWNGGKTDLSAFDMGQMLSVGTSLNVKFRLPLLQRGYCEAHVEVGTLEERAEGVKVSAVFTNIDNETREAVRQYAEDMAFLKEELKKATEEGGQA
ncbi:MAG: STAS domain-containing protein [Planctomycetota bacterium]|nr:STAS domain-containing protein [Planctomycetota bacterium]